MSKYSSIIFFLLFLSIKSSFSYPHFVGKGYTSCITCHYNPFGNGALNDYGRALAVTAVTSRYFVQDYVTEEELANKSGFLWSTPSKTSGLRVSADYRGLLLKRSFGQEGEDTELINMMADANVTYKFNQKGTYFASATLGYAPTPAALEDSDEEVANYRWRDLYFGARPYENFGVYVGLMDKVFGIRVAEHTNYSRSLTNLNQNDQAHGVQFHYSNPNYEVGGGVFLGNLNQDARLRQKGVSLKADYVVSHKSTTGVSMLKSSNEYMNMYMAAFHYKTSVGKGSAFLAEYGRIVKQALDESEDTNDYAFAQSYLNATRGLYIINSVEYLKEENGDYRIKYGPGIQIFPARSVELRFELFNARNFSKDSSTKDTWDFLGQTHLWF